MYRDVIYRREGCQQYLRSVVPSTVKGLCRSGACPALLRRNQADAARMDDGPTVEFAAAICIATFSASGLTTTSGCRIFAKASMPAMRRGPGREKYPLASSEYTRELRTAGMALHSSGNVMALYSSRACCAL